MTVMIQLMSDEQVTLRYVAHNAPCKRAASPLPPHLELFEVKYSQNCHVVYGIFSYVENVQNENP